MVLDSPEIGLQKQRHNWNKLKQDYSGLNKSCN